jgi:hypothetical protein
VALLYSFIYVFCVFAYSYVLCEFAHGRLSVLPGCPFLPPPLSLSVAVCVLPCGAQSNAHPSPHTHPSSHTRKPQQPKQATSHFGIKPGPFSSSTTTSRRPLWEENRRYNTRRRRALRPQDWGEEEVCVCVCVCVCLCEITCASFSIYIHVLCIDGDQPVVQCIEENHARVVMCAYVV